MYKVYILTLIFLSSLFSVGYVNSPNTSNYLAQNEPGMDPQSATEDYNYLMREAGIGEEEDRNYQPPPYYQEENYPR